MYEDREPLTLKPCPDCHVLTDGSGCLCNEDDERERHFEDEPDVDDDFPMYLEYPNEDMIDNTPDGDDSW